MLTFMTENYLAKEQKDPAELRKTGLFFDFVGTLGKYTSLMLGVYFISREEPNVLLTACGGIGYAIFGSLEKLGNLCTFRAEGQLTETKIEEVSEKIDDLERRISGRSTKIIQLTNKLDKLVEKDLKKQGVEFDDNPKKPL